MTCPLCEHENRPLAKFCEACATPLTATPARAPYAASLADLTAALSEAHAQQMATAEILRVISSSPTEIQPVLDAIAASANRLCGGLFTAVYRFDGELIHFVAHSDWSEAGLAAFQSTYPMRPTRDRPSGVAILARRAEHGRCAE